MEMLMGSWMMRCLRALSWPVPMIAGLEGVCGVVGVAGMEEKRAVEFDGGDVPRLWDGDAVAAEDARSRFGMLVFGPFAVEGRVARGEALRLEAMMRGSSSDSGESLSTSGFVLVFMLANSAQSRIERCKF